MHKVRRRFEAALRLHRNGDPAGARTAYQDVLSLEPDHPASLHHLGLLLHQSGDLSGAIEHLQRAVQSNTKDSVGHNNLGNLLVEAGRVEDSAKAYRQALACEPGYLNARLNLGSALSKLGRFDEALDCFKAVVDAEPTDAYAWSSLGGAYLDLGMLDESIQAHHQARALAPQSPDAHNALGLAYMDNGEFTLAADCYRAALALAPGLSKAALNLSKVKRFSPADDKDIALIESVLRQPGTTQHMAADVHFALGKVYDDCTSFSRAFRHYRSANDIRQREIPFSREVLRERIDDTIATFDAALFERFAGYGSDSDLPIFIVGMPRSGTTLVEQILASHRAVVGAGELSHLETISRSLGGHNEQHRDYPLAVKGLGETSLSALSQAYLHHLLPRAGTALRITDKAPGNYYHLGLIALMFPNAQVVHCQRNPVDVGLSLYFHQFSHGHGYCYSLANIAFVYRQYERLMGHWDRVLPKPAHSLRYEVLIADQEGVSRALLDTVGLDWDEQVLRFFDSKRAVHTASNWQVRQPVYAGAVERWRHYAGELADLRILFGELEVTDE